MVSLPKGKVQSFLSRISNNLEQGANHEKYIINAEGQEFIVPYIRGTQKDIGDKLIGIIAKELKIETNDFVNLVRTKGKKKDYINIFMKNKKNK